MLTHTEVSIAEGSSLRSSCDNTEIQIILLKKIRGVGHKINGCVWIGQKILFGTINMKMVKS